MSAKKYNLVDEAFAGLERAKNGRFKEKLTDCDIEIARQMFEEFPRGHPQHKGYKQLARIFECSTTAMQNYLTYRKRRGIPG